MNKIKYLVCELDIVGINIHTFGHTNYVISMGKLSVSTLNPCMHHIIIPSNQHIGMYIKKK